MASRLTVAALLPAMLAVSIFAAPSQARAEGDAARGQKLAYTCYGCHGIPNYKNVYPTYSVPKLEGQHAEYLALALEEYNKGERSHATMHSHAASMSEQDMQDIAAFLAGQPLQADAKPVGSQPKSAALCVSCHGANGIGITPQYPTLAGQHADYLERSLHDYKNGGRKNPVMVNFVAQLTDQEIVEIAEYYARQTPSLSTPEHALWFGSGVKNAENTKSAK